MRITINNLFKRFRSRDGIVVAVDDLSVEVAQGELVTLLGPSGCGKTTTLRCVAGLERSDSGQIRLGDTVVSDPAAGISVPAEKRGLGMVFQSYAIWPHLSVFDNIAFPLKLMRMSKPDIAGRVKKALETVDLPGMAERYPNQLSGGQQQRVALARAIVAEPGAVLFDEPLSNLDAKLRERMRIELVEMQKRLGWTALYVTHDQIEAMTMSDRVIVMDKGRVQQIGRPRELYDSPANRFVADFLGAANFMDGKLVGTPEGGLAIVETPAGRLKATMRGRPSPEGKVTICIRPEHLRLGDGAQQEESNCWQGIVQRSIFLGQSVQYLIQIEGGATLRAHGASRLPLQEGAQVPVRVPVDQCLALSE